MIFWLIVAQGFRIAVIWTRNYTIVKILRSMAYAAVGMYLLKRAKRQRFIDAKRGYTTDEKSRELTS